MNHFLLIINKIMFINHKIMAITQKIIKTGNKSGNKELITNIVLK
jgi:hypothetical protein